MWSVSIDRHEAAHPFHFFDLLRLQEATLERIRPSSDSALLFAELPPTLTLGARQLIQDKEASLRWKREGLEVVPGERGGQETWHGPGQWVGFVLTPLQEFTGDPRGVRKAVYKMLECLLPVAQAYQPSAHLEEDSRLGIWTDHGKLVSIGIKIRNGYTSSGFALNCIPDERAFSGIHPCGLTGSVPDFLFRDVIPEKDWAREFLEIPALIEARFVSSK